MTFINDLFKRLFKGQGGRLSHKENFSQSGEEQERIKHWMGSEAGKEAFALIHKNYHYNKAGMRDYPEVHILSSPYANGFAVTFEPPLTEETFSNLFFAFGVRILDMGYYRVSLDRRMVEEAEMVRTVEKQYLKPAVRPDPSLKMDQLFGNISVEKVMLDNKPAFLKVLVTVYSDRLYLNAKPFDTFMEKLFTLDTQDGQDSI
ncbi:MAG TPA: hypothetical protein VKZ51_07690 [Cyclobacteriaceae bacterium]|nr:hypothetical protein [Cyclobacteriaceae bacterium]